MVNKIAIENSTKSKQNFVREKIVGRGGFQKDKASSFLPSRLTHSLTAVGFQKGRNH
jgi:hypothetical protein